MENGRDIVINPRHTGRLPCLDGLRAFSIILVLWEHASATKGFPVHWPTDGGLGVRIFFVISGYLITFLMFREEERTGTVSLPKFYFRRALRILPTFWGYLALICILNSLGIVSVRFLYDIVQPITFTNSLPFWAKHVGWDTGHSWSLAIEEQFYLLWPVVFVLSNARWRTVIASVVVLLGPVARYWIYAYPQRWAANVTIVTQGDMLAWGCLFAILTEYSPDMVHAIVNWRPGIGRIIAIMVIEFSPWYFHQSFYKKCPPLSTIALSMSAQACAIAYLIASLTAIRKGWLYQILNVRPLVLIGLMSYSLYICQQVFMHPGMSRVWTTWPTNIVCVVIVSTATYYLVEQPMRKLERYGRGSKIEHGVIRPGRRAASL